MFSGFIKNKPDNKSSALDGTATAADILLNKTAYATHPKLKLTGTIPINSAETKALAILALLNLITNGNFVNGTTGWVANAASMSAASNILNFTATTQWGSVTQIVTTPSVGDKIYIYAKMYGATSARMYFEQASGGGIAFASPTQPNVWQTLSGYAIVPSGVTWGKLTFQDTAVSGWAAIQVQNVVAVNLTKVFGAGLEPTQAQMDAIMTALGGWFDGGTLIGKLPNGAFIANGATGAPDILINDPNFIPANLALGKIVYGVTGTSVVIVSFTAGDSIIYDDSASVTTTSATPVKIYELKMLVSGSIRFKFNLKSMSGGVTASAQIYKNGVAVGTLRTNATSSDITFSEDISFGINDLIQIYGYSNNISYAASVSNIILGNSVVIPAVTRTL